MYSSISICIVIILISVISLSIIALVRYFIEERMYSNPEYKQKVEKKEKVMRLARYYLNEFNDSINVYNTYFDSKDIMLREFAEKAKNAAIKYAKAYNALLEENINLWNGRIPRKFPKSLPLIIDVNELNNWCKKAISQCDIAFYV